MTATFDPTETLQRQTGADVPAEQRERAKRLLAQFEQRRETLSGTALTEAVIELFDGQRMLGDEEMAALVERVGSLFAYFDAHAEKWDDAEYQKRRDKMLQLHREMWQALTVRGERITDHGWDVTNDGRWYRLAEKLEPRPETYWSRLYQQVVWLLKPGMLAWATENRPRLAERITRAIDQANEEESDEAALFVLRECRAVAIAYAAKGAH